MLPYLGIYTHADIILYFVFCGGASHAKLTRKKNAEKKKESLLHNKICCPEMKWRKPLDDYRIGVDSFMALAHTCISPVI